MERVSTFSKVGKVFNGDLVSGIPAEMAFSVSKMPLGYEDGGGHFVRVPGVSTIVNDVTGRSYGAVSDKYVAVDNATALGCLQYIENLDIKRYGETKNGMQYIIGSLPDVTILGDSFTPYLIFRNSFNGKYPIQAAISPLRIVCQNQLTMAFREAENTFNIRHTLKAVERLEEAQHILLGVGDYMTELNRQAEKYATIHLSEIESARVLSELFPIKDDMSDRQKDNIKLNRANFVRAIGEADNANFKGTAWGLINAYSDYLSHPVALRQTETADENTFVAVTFDPRFIGNLVNIINSVAVA